MNRPLPVTLFSLTVLPLIAGSVVAVILTMDNQSQEARYAAILALSYLIGSVPWGYILLRWRRGVDIREYGSGRIGMSNVLRTGGGRIAGLVLVLDLSKGILVVLLAREVIGGSSGEVAAGLAVLAGHNWPIFLGFRGGRGVATGLGAMSVMVPIATGIGALAFILITLISRYLSLGSISALVITCMASLGLTLAGVYPSGYTLFAFVSSAVIIWQHRDNIRRIRQGDERRLGQPASQAN